jgi:uncharacterized membrane protein
MVTKKKKTESSNTTDNTKICAILSYLLIGIIWYFVDKQIQKDDFVKFHVKQGLVLICLSIILSIIISIIPFLWMIGWIVQLIFFIFAIIGIINAMNHEKKELPIIGQFSSVFKF